MEMSPLERAARALAGPDAGVFDHPQTYKSEDPAEAREYYLSGARAVLDAIREPSGDMVTTAMSMHGDITGPAVELVWTTMIDSALSGKLADA